MLKKMLIAAGVLSVLAAPALAGEATCAAMLEKAAKAAETVKLDDAAKQALADMQKKAEEQAKAGDEKGCQATAAEMLKALGVE